MIRRPPRSPLFPYTPLFRSIRRRTKSVALPPICKPALPLRERSWSERPNDQDRKSTRLNSSHSQISYAVFCLKKKKDSHIELRHSHTATLSHHSAHDTNEAV